MARKPKQPKTQSTILPLRPSQVATFVAESNRAVNIKKYNDLKAKVDKAEAELPKAARELALKSPKIKAVLSVYPARVARRLEVDLDGVIYRSRRDPFKVGVDLGGDTFYVILKGRDRQRIQRIMDRIEKLQEELREARRSGVDSRITSMEKDWIATILKSDPKAAAEIHKIAMASMEKFRRESIAKG